MGRGGRQFISSVLIYRKCAKRKDMPFTRKRWLLRKNMSQLGVGCPHRPPLWIRHCWPPQVEAFSRPNAQPVNSQQRVSVCVYWHKTGLWWAVFVLFILVRRPHCASRSTTLAISSQPNHTGRESVDQWSRVATGTVVEQIASIAAVIYIQGGPIKSKPLLNYH